MNYSKRQLYALGEPLGNSATRSKLGGGRIYGGGGGGGGWISDIGNTISDVVQGAGDTLASIDPGPAIGSGLASIDQGVRDVIPGGWATVGLVALAVVTMGATSELIPAEVGVAGTETLADGTLVTTMTDGTIATTAVDGTTTFAAADGTVLGTTDASAAALQSAATDAGFTSVPDFQSATSLGYTDAGSFTAGQAGGFTDAAQFTTASNAGFTNAASYADATLNGFTNAASYDAATNAGLANMADYTAAMDAGGFTDAGTFNTALNSGFTDAATFDQATGAGFTNAAQYDAATNLGYTNAQDFASGQLGNFSNAAEYQQAANLGYTNASDFSAGELGGYANAQDFTTASNLGYADNAQYQVGLQHGFANADELMTASTNAGFSDVGTYGQALDAGFGASGSGGLADWLTAKDAGISDYWTYAKAIAAGLIIPKILSGVQPGQQGGGINWGYAGEAPWTWGQQAMPVNPGTNPGWLAGNVTPHYQNTTPDQAQYYWGQHPALTSANNVAQQWNNVPNAPAQPWGEATSAVGGTQQLDVNQFIQNTVGNPTYAASAAGTQPGGASTIGTPYVAVPGGVATAPGGVATAPGGVATLPTAPIGATPVMPTQEPTIGEQVPPLDIKGPAIPVSIPMDPTQYGDLTPVNGAISPVIA